MSFNINSQHQKSINQKENRRIEFRTGNKPFGIDFIEKDVETEKV